MEKVIVTICREYGSGGRIIGERVAERLGVPYYNRNLIDMAAKESGLAEGYINKFEEKVSSPFVWGIPMGRNEMCIRDSHCPHRQLHAAGVKVVCLARTVKSYSYNFFHVIPPNIRMTCKMPLCENLR